ncbi:hypothetical protein QLH52_04245 [Methylomonas sp. OY6]|uniref:SPFH domain/Band 7 family protein n=1 Tax=Methylomonas defluvii TaxID=3045149 RepID=A0ABU4UBE0_9GAMM|nr:hypothetical protein [Methylomonas sp. OY6]MDX8126478.1 hypothetical protein [Methylomonas sp. OY6]
MKLSYYGYVFTEVKTGVKYRMPIKNFIQAFCQFKDPNYKNKFTHNGEHIFLLHGPGDLYLFIQTRSKEVIKKINSQDTSVGEIYDVLDKDEMLGFASYVFVMDSYLGFASTTMAPRLASFGNFINDVLSSIGITEYQFNLIPFLHQATKAEAMSMPFIGKSTIQINKSNDFFDDIANYLGGSADEFEDVDSLEIVIEPKARKDIGKAVKKMMARIPDEGLEKLVVRAKDDLHPSLIDLYLAGNGIVADNINTRDEREIATKIREKITNNSVLKKKVIEHEQDEAIKQGNVESISKFCDAGSWSSALSDLQEND